MANPRRTSFQLPVSSPGHPIPISLFQFQTPTQTVTAATVTRFFTLLKSFLKKPHAFPFLLSIFLLLTWVSLRFQSHSASRTTNPSFHQSSYNSAVDESFNGEGGGYLKDSEANVVKFSTSSPIVMKDKRGWIFNPVSLALDATISGGALSCVSVHVGEIRPGSMRGNHRHHICNETFVIWGAKTVFRLENNAMTSGYSEVTINADEVGVAASPSGTAHALVNIDAVRTTYFMGCQDRVVNYNSSTTDFKIWNDL